MAETAAAEIVVVSFSGKSSESGRVLIFGVGHPSSFVKSISDVDEEGVCLLLDGIEIISESWTISFFVSEGILNNSMEGFRSA